MLTETLPEEFEVLSAGLLAARNHRDACKADLEEADRDLREAEAALAAVMNEAEIDSVGYRDRVLVRHVRETWSLSRDRRDQAVAILKRHAPALVRETVNSSTLSCYVRRSGRDLQTAMWWRDLEPLLEIRKRDAITVRAAHLDQPRARRGYWQAPDPRAP